MTTDVEVLKKSVTRDDHSANPNGGAFYLFVNTLYGQAPQHLPATPPAYWSFERDDVLRATVYAEDMWGSAVGKAITKVGALGWTVSDTQDSQLRVKRAQDLLLQADAGLGWVQFISKHLRDFLTTDNGAFVEIVRASNAAGGKILGLFHLDSRRCRRTGDPMIPVIYRDRLGREHELRDYQVMTFADLPDPGESFFGVGLCAASRAYKTIVKIASLENYFTEKITGNRALELHFIQGITKGQVTDAVTVAEAQQTAKGRTNYMGVVVIPVMDDKGVTGYRVPLAEVPDGFDPKQERDNAYIKYANAIGVAVQDIQPLSGQGLGTGTQTLILDEAAEGQGLAAWRQQFTHNANTWLLPNTTTFGFATNDIRDQKAKAEVQKLRADTRGAMITSGEISVVEARQMAADSEDIPKEFLAEDLTPGGTLQDDEKPLTGEAAEPATAEPVADAELTATKAISDVDKLYQQELARARKLYQEVAA